MVQHVVVNKTTGVMNPPNSCKDEPYKTLETNVVMQNISNPLADIKLISVPHALKRQKRTIVPITAPNSPQLINISIIHKVPTDKKIIQTSVNASKDQRPQAVTVQQKSGPSPQKHPSENANNFQPFVITSSDFKSNPDDSAENQNVQDYQEYDDQVDYDDAKNAKYINSEDQQDYDDKEKDDQPIFVPDLEERPKAAEKYRGRPPDDEVEYVDLKNNTESAEDDTVGKNKEEINIDPKQLEQFSRHFIEVDDLNEASEPIYESEASTAEENPQTQNQDEENNEEDKESYEEEQENEEETQKKEKGDKGTESDEKNSYTVNYSDLYQYEPIEEEPDIKEDFTDEDDDYDRFRKTSKNDYLKIKANDFVNAETPYEIQLGKDFYDYLEKEIHNQEKQDKQSSERSNENEELQDENGDAQDENEDVQDGNEELQDENEDAQDINEDLQNEKEEEVEEEEDEAQLSKSSSKLRPQIAQKAADNEMTESDNRYISQNRKDQKKRLYGKKNKSLTNIAPKKNYKKVYQSSDRQIQPDKNEDGKPFQDDNVDKVVEASEIARKEEIPAKTDGRSAERIELAEEDPSKLLDIILQKKDAISRHQNINEEPKEYKNYWTLEYEHPH